MRLWTGLLIFTLSFAASSQDNNMEKGINAIRKGVPIVIEKKDLTDHFAQKMFRGFTVAKIDRSDKNVRVPRKLARKIQKMYMDYYRRVNPKSTLTDAELRVRIPRKYLALDVLLKERKEGVLKGYDLRFSMPRGGGIIDLADFVKEGKGTFYVRTIARESPQSQEVANGILVYFVSNSRKRPLDRRLFGSGCDSFMDLTTFYNEVLSLENGLPVNATAQRYLSVLAGTFYFVYPTKQALHLASITFEDSRYPDLQCRRET